jgi:hypothetical protein
MTENHADIIKYAYEKYKNALSLPIENDLKASSVWVAHISTILEKAFQTNDLFKIFAIIQEENGFTFPRKNDNSEFFTQVTEYEAWLKALGFDLEKADFSLQESFLSSPKIQINRKGRSVSTMFYWHLCTCMRFTNFYKSQEGGSPGRILEIGGGFGGLARIFKLIAPNVKYFILDLPQSLFFSFLYVKTNFPDLKCCYVDSANLNFDEVINDNDFIFVPTGLIGNLINRSFDGVINTQSLGEMTDNAVKRYMRFIHEDIQTKYFYSINRFGRHQANSRYCGPRDAGEDGCKMSVILDHSWKIYLWDLYAKNGFFWIENASPPSLEILAERMPTELLSTDNRKFIAENLYAEAKLMPQRDERWQYLMWDSIRTFPLKPAVSDYCEFLKINNYLEYAYYASLLSALCRQGEFEKQSLGAPKATVAEMMRTALAFVEQGQIAQALEYYRKVRVGFSQTPEIAEFDELIEKVRQLENNR